MIVDVPILELQEDIVEAVRITPQARGTEFAEQSVNVSALLVVEDIAEGVHLTPRERGQERIESDHGGNLDS